MSHSRADHKGKPHADAIVDIDRVLQCAMCGRVCEYASWSLLVIHSGGVGVYGDGDGDDDDLRTLVVEKQ